MSAPVRIDTIIDIWKSIGEPTFSTVPEVRSFSRMAVAVLAYVGDPARGIGPDQRWGLRMTESGTSKDVLRHGEEAIDILAGSSNPTKMRLPSAFHWFVLKPEDIGIERELPSRQFLPTVDRTPKTMPVSSFDHDWWRQVITNLNQLYREELGREFIIGGELDTEGLSLRLFQLLESGWNLNLIRDDIRRSSEWAARHTERDVRMHTEESK